MQGKIVTVDAGEDFRKLLKDIFTDDFMKENTNFNDFENFQYSSAVIVNWKADQMVYAETLLDDFVKESTKFTSWDEMVKAAADAKFGAGE